MRLYLRLLKFLLPYWLKLVVALVCMVVFAVANGLMAYLIGPAIKLLFDKDKAPQGYGIPTDIVTFFSTQDMQILLPLAIIAVALIRGISSYGNTYYMGYVGQRVIADLRRRLYEHLLELPYEFFVRNPAGGLTSRLTNDINLLEKATADTLVHAFKHGLSVVVLVVIIVMMDWQLALVGGIAFPIAIYPAMRFGRRIKNISRKGQVTLGDMASIIHEAIKGIRVVKGFGMKRYEVERFSEENERFSRYRTRAIKIRGISSPFMETFASVTFALTIWYASYRISAGTLTPEAFLTFFAGTVMLYQPVRVLNGVYLNLQQGLGSAQRIFELLDTPTEALKDGTRQCRGLEDSIEFKDVSFAYGQREVLRGINLKVRKGERIAIVGSSGVGKSTLVNLIPRFYDVTGGSILIDGVDIREFSLESLRRQISIISQDVVLFNDTVRNNIAYGRPDIKLDDVVRAAQSANAHQFIEELPQGYDTVIGEGGIRLSGGQRQRLSIARAILKDAPILIMDEATSSLDAESERAVQQGLKNLMEGRTTFVIAHRFSTIKDATRIVVLAGGTIAEVGSHEELMQKSGEYRRLYSLQFQG